jgi:hypothetical protein
MIHRRTTLAATLALLVTGTCASSAPGSEPTPDRVQVRGAEFDLVLSKQKLAPGQGIVQFLNEGEDPHDLKLQRVNSSGAPLGPELSIGVVAPGAYENLAARFKKRSTYVFWCSLSDHRQRGMEATLRTKKRG